jgi:hypothetical protein
MSYPQSVRVASPNGEVSEDEACGIASVGLAMSLGLTRQMTETYSVGGYRYTNLTDAIAEARRMTKLEAKLP